MAANVVMGVDPRNGCAEKLQPLPVPRVSEVVGPENVGSILECTGMLEWDVASHSGAEKVPVFLGRDVLCHAKRSLSERRLLRPRCRRTSVSSMVALRPLHALNPSTVCPAVSGLELHMCEALTGGSSM